ncbi:PLC-like phosphodiesterase [Ramaria rubella]|nr:PLC-like phosphodiesterase [Ramaria rubella]
MFLLFTLTLLLISCASSSPGKRASLCNGHAELCNRSYGNITFVGAHDSYAFSEDPLAVARDQRIDIPTQLANGVRLLQAQSHMWEGEVHFCHTSCLLFDGGTVADYLAKVMTFLEANPNEVLTLLFTNPEGLAVDTIWEPIFNSSGIDQFAYIPPSLPVPQSDWPTLEDLIQSGKRVVVFMDYNSDTSKVPYILPEFEMIWETPFDITNSSFPCTVDRISGPLAQDSHMNLLNHYLDVSLFSVLIPDEFAADTTNSVASVLAGANSCAPLNGGRGPNFVLVDWVDIGDVFGAAEQLNALGNGGSLSVSVGVWYLWGVMMVFTTFMI